MGVASAALRAMESEKNWYVIHTYSGYENKVKANLEKKVHSLAMENEIFRVMVPMEDEVEIKDGKKKISKKKVFPGICAGGDDRERPVLVCCAQYAWGYRVCRFRHQAHPAYQR